MRSHTVVSILLVLSVVCSAQDERVGRVNPRRERPQPEKVTPAPESETSTDKEPVGFMWVRYAKEISSHVPKTMMIAHTPSLQLEKSQERKDLPKDIIEREVAYTWDWVRKAVQPMLLRKSEGIPKDEDFLSKSKTEDFRFFSGVGVHKDDVLLLAWSRGPLHFTVVDGRFLVLSVRMANKSEADVEATFKRVVAYGSYADRARFKAQMETLSPTDSSDTWGRITVDRGRHKGWFESPVEWYHVGNEVMFAFEKVTKPGLSKTSCSEKDGFCYIGGLPVQDSRSYLRFEKSNRKELAAEYFLKRIRKEPVPRSISRGAANPRKTRQPHKKD